MGKYLRKKLKNELYSTCLLVGKGSVFTRYVLNEKDFSNYKSCKMLPTDDSYIEYFLARLNTKDKMTIFFALKKWDIDIFSVEKNIRCIGSYYSTKSDIFKDRVVLKHEFDSMIFFSYSSIPKYIMPKL